MLDIVVIIVAVSIVVAIITTLEFLSRICDWLEQIHDRQGKILMQNVNIQRQLDQIIHGSDLDGLEFVNMNHPRTENKND